MADFPRLALRPLLRLADFRPERRADFLALDPRADFLAPFFADFLADLLVDFFADFLPADFLPADFLPADFLLADFLLADFLPEAFLAPPFLAVFFRARAFRGRDAGSSPSPNEDEEELGLEEGVLSIGSGSIHPEPDQPISI